MMSDALRVDDGDMTFLTVKRGKLTVAISEGGVSVIGKGWDYTCEIKPPANAGKLTKAEKDAIADKAIKECKKYGKEMDKL